jgi:hypothetical protein
VRDQVSHPYKTTGRIMVLYVLTFTFLDSRRDDKTLNRMVYNGDSGSKMINERKKDASLEETEKIISYGHFLLVIC